MNVIGPSSLPDAERIYLLLLEKLKHAYPAAQRSVLNIAGIGTGGVLVAQRLAQDLQVPHFGSINVAFHRDDYNSKGLKTSTQSTVLPFDINHKEIMLVDDVLYTGRTVRAAINELFDFGRPHRILLSVLVNRIESGVRELPFAANFAGADLALPPDQILLLEQNQQGRFIFTLTSKHG
jgi:pyrimidine operon attenuation protein/uracil phosphoribosyltransferase